jgi:hypothetical protein
LDIFKNVQNPFSFLLFGYTFFHFSKIENKKNKLNIFSITILYV